MRLLRSIAGVLLAAVFMVALTTSLGLTLVLVKDVIQSRGDWGEFEAAMRHYSDRLDSGPDGRLVMHRAEHPVAAFLAMFAGSWVVALLSAYGFHRLRRQTPPPLT